MSLIQGSIRYPVSTAVGVILLILFGTIALFHLPVQLTPDVEEPIVTVYTAWPGASPYEIEREIVEEQEEQLKSVEGLVRMESSSQEGVGSVSLFFQVGTNKDSALLKVSNRLEQVQRYPEDADKPVIRASNQNANAIAWFSLEPLPENGFTGDLSTLESFADDFIKPEFERVPGIAAANLFGGREREAHVIVDPARLAARQITLNELAAALERENRNYSGGDFDEGKRRYIVRTVGEYRSPEDIESIVIAVRNSVPIYLRDVARAELGYRKAEGKAYEFDRQVLFMNGVKDTGSNVIEVMADLKEAVQRLNDDLLQERGLRLVQVWDQTTYIHSAIGLVTNSLVVGSLLAVGVLLLFLRSVSSTLVLAVTIPISMIGTFLMMWWFGRTLNVVSLAGLAFASGLVVDNSIVVLENIYRHRQMGKSRLQAAVDGTQEVWGAVLASTLTTIAVFVPVVFMKEQVGQLFGDIAVAITFTSAISLIVSFTVIPCLSARILGVVGEAGDGGFASGSGAGGGARGVWGWAERARRMNAWVGRTVHSLTASTRRSLAVAAGFTLGSVALSLLLLPKTEYLPMGNQNFLFGMLLPPPGYNLDEVTALHNLYSGELKHLWAPRETPQLKDMPGGGVSDFFFVGMRNLAFMGASARDPARVRELIPEFQRANAKVPGAIVMMDQASIFAEEGGAGRNIDVGISGPDLERLIELGGEVFQGVLQNLPGSQAFPIPSLDLGNPEVQVRVHRQRAAEMGLSNRDLGFAISALVDGAKASDYMHEGKEIDLRVMAEKGFAHRTHLLEQMPIATPQGRLVTLGSVAEVTLTTGPVQIDHRERQRTITIRVSPAPEMPLEAAMDQLQAKVLGPMQEAGKLGGLYRVTLSGSADKLVQAADALWWNFLLASAITYLLMAALFESFLYPFVIMFSVPLAVVGGFLGLGAINLFLVYQPLDVITMLGFIILVGSVVNNAILIVHQALHHIRQEGMDPRQAIQLATETRTRPIFMSVCTSVLGMIPLVLFPGAGSELYRGLGGVLVGGLVVSTVFTLFLVPAVLSLCLSLREAFDARLRRLLPAGRAASAASAVGDHPAS